MQKTVSQEQQTAFELNKARLSNMPQHTPQSQVEQVKSYLIDCVGYSEDDLQGMSKFELYELVTDVKEMNAYIGGMQ